MIRSVVVFCSSSDHVSPIYFSEIELLAQELVKHKISIIYGGGRSGLMGRLADAALARGGQVVGVIPHYLAKPGIQHEGLTELVVVDDLLDRKRKMLSMADAAIAAPGGIGTIDEVTEVLALKQLSEHAKPVLIHNFLDCWLPLLDFFEELKMRHMISHELNELYAVCDSAEDVVRRLK